jgi:predicted nucleotidyltransferase
LQGKFNGHDYYIRCIKDAKEINERYGTSNYQSIGYSKIEAKIADDSQSIYTPCQYRIEDVKTIEGSTIYSIKKIVSFRGRFCEQARNGETVIAQGKIELVKQGNVHKHYQMVLGNNITDFMILK